MEYRTLGSSGLKVSAISLGSWQTYGKTVDTRAANDCVRAALDAGINFFDTADVYPGAEEALGEAVTGVPRDSVIIGTKCFFPMSDDPSDRGLSRQHIIKSVERSLRRLKMDHVELMQCHRFDPETPLEETVRAMEDLIAQGKIRHWGISKFSATQTTDAVVAAKKCGASLPVAQQWTYSILNPSIEKDGVLEACRANGIGLLAYSPLAQGVLTGKYGSGAAPAGSRGANAETKGNMWNLTPKDIAKVEELKTVAREAGLSLPQLALAWCLRDQAVSSAIIGASKPSQVVDNVKAVGVKLSAETLGRIASIMTGAA